MRISDISDDDLVFLRSDGTPSENAIYTQETKDGEIMFFELLGHRLGSAGHPEPCDCGVP